MALTLRRSRDPIEPAARTDDYLVEGDEVERPPVGARVAHVLLIVLIFVLALLSLSVFWLIGLMLNIF